MKKALLRWLEKLGHIQARVLLTLFYFIILTPYGLLVSCFHKKLLPHGQWHEIDEAETTLVKLRRSF